MNETSRTGDKTTSYPIFSYEWMRYRVIYRFFGEYSKASFKLCHYQYLVSIFLIGVRNGLRDRSVFILKRPFFAVINGLKVLERIGTFYWIKHWIHQRFPLICKKVVRGSSL